MTGWWDSGRARNRLFSAFGMALLATATQGAFAQAQPARDPMAPLPAAKPAPQIVNTPPPTGTGVAGQPVAEVPYVAPVIPPPLWSVGDAQALIT